MRETVLTPYSAAFARAYNQLKRHVQTLSNGNGPSIAIPYIGL
jgi:hypothetical protein